MIKMKKLKNVPLIVTFGIFSLAGIGFIDSNLTDNVLKRV